MEKSFEFFVTYIILTLKIVKPYFAVRVENKASELVGV